MNPIDQRVIEVLRALSEVCRESAQGFQRAAEHARVDQARSSLADFSAERHEYERELQAQVFALGGAMKSETTMSGSLHRGWMNLKASIASHEPASWLAECERLEAAAVTAYRTALEAELDPETRTMVSRQLRGVEWTNLRLNQMGEALTSVNLDDDPAWPATGVS